MATGVGRPKSDATTTSSTPGPALPALPQTPQQSGLQNLSGLALILQGRPDLAPQAIAHLESTRQLAEQQAELRFQRELSIAGLERQDLESSRTEARAGRMEARQDRAFEADEEQRRWERVYNAAKAAADKHYQEMSLKLQQDSLDLQVKALLDARVVQLGQRMQEVQAQAAALVGARGKAGAGVKRSPLDPGKLSKYLNPQQLAEYFQAQATQGSEAAAQIAATALKTNVDAFNDVFGTQGLGAQGVSTSEYLRTVGSLIRNDATIQALAKSAGVDPTTLISPDLMPTYLGDLPPEAQVAASKLTTSLLPAFRKGYATPAEREAIAVNIRLLGELDQNFDYVSKLSDAIATDWEVRFGKPHDTGLALIADLIEDEASDEEIEWAVPISPEEAQAKAKEAESGSTKILGRAAPKHRMLPGSLIGSAIEETTRAAGRKLKLRREKRPIGAEGKF